MRVSAPAEAVKDVLGGITFRRIGQISYLTRLRESGKPKNMGKNSLGACRIGFIVGGAAGMFCKVVNAATLAHEFRAAVRVGCAGGCGRAAAWVFGAPVRDKASASAHRAGVAHDRDAPATCKSTGLVSAEDSEVGVLVWSGVFLFVLFFFFWVCFFFFLVFFFLCFSPGPKKAHLLSHRGFARSLPAIRLDACKVRGLLA